MAEALLNGRIQDSKLINFFKIFIIFADLFESSIIIL